MCDSSGCTTNGQGAFPVSFVACLIRTQSSQGEAGCNRLPGLRCTLVSNPVEEPSQSAHHTAPDQNKNVGHQGIQHTYAGPQQRDMDGEQDEVLPEEREKCK